MTDFGIDFRSSEDFGHLHDRVAAAKAQTRANAERYVQLRRTVDATREDTREIRAQAAKVREALRDSVMAYAAVLRGTAVPPQRAVVLAAGSVTHFLLAFVLLFAVLVGLGVPTGRETTALASVS